MFLYSNLFFQMQSVIEFSLPRPTLKGRLFDMLRDHYDNRIMTTTSLTPISAVQHRHPMRIVCVIDVSQSMTDTYANDNVSKLDRVKAFIHMLVNSLNEEDSLGIVTFGTKAKVLCRLNKVTAEFQVRESVLWVIY